MTDVDLDAFMSKINKAYDPGTIAYGSRMPTSNLLRFSSGIFDLDLALGGGWPFARYVTLAGDESTGKSTIALQACRSVNDYCRNCRIHKDKCSCGKYKHCRAMFIDAEHSFDLAWAKTHGYNEDLNPIVRTEYAEQAIDIVDAAIRDNVVELIVIDSVAALTPKGEIEASAEDWQVGLAARLMNKACRRWTASLSNSPGQFGPCILAINQLREKIGVMYGDPRTMPGGKGQLFASSIIIWTKAPKVQDDPESKTSGFVELRGITKKNKTFVPKIDYGFDMALKDLGHLFKGQIDNISSVFNTCKKFGLVEKKSGRTMFDIDSAPTEIAFKTLMRTKPALVQKMWRAATKHIVGSCSI
jgi:recombination protein RecA